MLTLRLPDGSIRQAAVGSRPRDVAEAIGKRLAQAAIAARVDGVITDLDRELPNSDREVPFQILTDKGRDALDVLRAPAPVMARAGCDCFGNQVGVRPDDERLLLRHRFTDSHPREDFRHREEMESLARSLQAF
jgi:threonyl-tRNA synthetase